MAIKQWIRRVTRREAFFVASLFLFITLTIGIALRGRTVTVRRSGEMPVAFWAWQTDLPLQDDLDKIREETGFDTLFLRAGQIDFEKGEVRRIREARGDYPRGVNLHLVYNGTRSLLASMERASTESVAATIIEAFGNDCRRSVVAGAHVVGVQLDLDVPTRLLPLFARLLRSVRRHLTDGMKLSITGLPTWMDSPDLTTALKQADFWVPQYYGAMIPRRLDNLIPITSLRSVSQAVDRTNLLKFPFFAGLPAYGYAVHYSNAGVLLALYGDLDPAFIAGNPHLEMVERRPFDGREWASNWRYVYRARADAVIGGLVLRSGEFMMVEQPNAAMLQACVEVVRERAGETFLGLCLFRLPTTGDATNLSSREVSAAVRGQLTEPVIAIKIRSEYHEVNGEPQLLLTVRVANEGVVASWLGSEAFALQLRLPEAALLSVESPPTFPGQALFAGNRGSPGTQAAPCAIRRANMLQFGSAWWPPGARAGAVIKLKEAPVGPLAASIRMRASDGKFWQEERLVSVSER